MLSPGDIVSFPPSSDMRKPTASSSPLFSSAAATTLGHSLTFSTSSPAPFSTVALSSSSWPDDVLHLSNVTFTLDLSCLALSALLPSSSLLTTSESLAEGAQFPLSRSLSSSTCPSARSLSLLALSTASLEESNWDQRYCLTLSLARPATALFLSWSFFSSSSSAPLKGTLITCSMLFLVLFLLCQVNLGPERG